MKLSNQVLKFTHCANNENSYFVCIQTIALPDIAFMLSKKTVSLGQGFAMFGWLFGCLDVWMFFPLFFSTIILGPLSSTTLFLSSPGQS